MSTLIDTVLSIEIEVKKYINNIGAKQASFSHIKKTPTIFVAKLKDKQKIKFNIVEATSLVNNIQSNKGYHIRYCNNKFIWSWLFIHNIKKITFSIVKKANTHHFNGVEIMDFYNRTLNILKARNPLAHPTLKHNKMRNNTDLIKESEIILNWWKQFNKKIKNNL